MTDANMSTPDTSNYYDIRETNNMKANMRWMPVGNALNHLDGESTLDKVERMLKSGLNGQWNMMCHHVGTEKLLLRLNWAAASEDGRIRGRPGT